MTWSWRRRLAVVMGCWAAVVATMVGLGMQPNPIVLAAVAAVAGVIGALLLDLSDIAAPVDWRTTREGSGRGIASDVRVSALRRQLGAAGALGSDDMVHTSLVAIIDDRLLVEHAVDRRAQPAAAAALLGPDLVEFVTGSPSRDRWADPRFLPAVLDRIEAL
jgi:hypothetical protein